MLVLLLLVSHLNLHTQATSWVHLNCRQDTRKKKNPYDGLRDVIVSTPLSFLRRDGGHLGSMRGNDKECIAFYKLLQERPESLPFCAWCGLSTNPVCSQTWRLPLAGRTWSQHPRNTASSCCPGLTVSPTRKCQQGLVWAKTPQRKTPSPVRLLPSPCPLDIPSQS